jgi:beta-carotene hydroxylase
MGPDSSDYGALDMTARYNDLETDISALSGAELLKLERKIATRHSQFLPWGIVLWAFGNILCWLSLWPLILSHTIPLWLGFVVATINMALVYLPTHEAQHYIIGRPGTKWYWLNEAVGHGTSWLFLYPYEFLRVTHLDHHRFANNRDLDPDINTHADSALQAIWATIRNRQPDSPLLSDYARCLLRHGRADLIDLALIYRSVYLVVLIGLAVSGYAIEAFFLIWLPYQIGITYIQFFLSYAPHSHGPTEGRYLDTRNWRSKVGNIGSMGMQFHIVHHLYPYIPLSRTPAAYREMRPILIARGCQMEN